MEVSFPDQGKEINERLLHGITYRIAESEGEQPFVEDQGFGGGQVDIDIATDSPDAVEILVRQVACEEFGVPQEQLRLVTSTRDEYEGKSGAVDEDDFYKRQAEEAQVRQRTEMLHRIARGYDVFGLAAIRAAIGRLDHQDTWTLDRLCGLGRSASLNTLTRSLADWFAFGFDDGNTLDQLYGAREEVHQALYWLDIYIIEEQAKRDTGGGR